MNAAQVPESSLFNTVVSGGYCIGCGACAAFDPNIRIKLDEYGRYQAKRESVTVPLNPVASKVCPFADGVPDENAIAKEVFPDLPFDSQLGYQRATYAGWVEESDFRAMGSSGGMASWLSVELLNQNLVDYVVHVAPNPTPAAGAILFQFAISSTASEVRAKAKSRYYPVEMSGVISEMLQRPGRYAVVGIPCFIKALRLSALQSETLKERLKYTIGIVCGHLKSTGFAELFAWQCGIAPADLISIDFRTKLPDRPASSYAVTVTGNREGQEVTVTKPTSELLGSNWGHGFFKYKACDFCDDVVGETADISIGDAWLSEYESDPRGTNVVIVRSQQLHDLLSAAQTAGRLHLDSITPAKAAESQAGGFRHRRDGLAFRLFLADLAGIWRPRKRVASSSVHLTSKLRKIHQTRHELAMASHEAFADAKRKGDLGVFITAMTHLTRAYDRLYFKPPLRRVIGRLMRFSIKLFMR